MFRLLPEPVLCTTPEGMFAMV